jgi:response regulator RpfG family c-di-GMP phosphodiesterase
MSAVPARVLLVDDELPILRSLRRLLTMEDFLLSEANDADSALKLLQQQPTAVILSDFNLGTMGGVDLLRRARDIAPETSRILFSGHIDVELLRTAVNGGEVYRFITKPWNDDELIQAVRQGIERWQLLNNNRALREQTQRQNLQLKDFNAELEHMVAVRTTALELRNRALMLSQEVLDGLPVAVIGIAPDGQIALTNQLARTLFPTLMPGEYPPMQTTMPLWEWSKTALIGGNSVIHDDTIGPLRVEVVALGERGVVMTVIPLQTPLPASLPTAPGQPT